MLRPHTYVHDGSSEVSALPLAVATQESPSPSPAFRGKPLSTGAKENDPSTVPDNAGSYPFETAQSIDSTARRQIEERKREVERRAAEPAPRAAEKKHPSDKVPPSEGEAASPDGKERQPARSVPPVEKQETFVTNSMAMWVVVFFSIAGGLALFRDISHRLFRN